MSARRRGNLGEKRSALVMMPSLQPSQKRARRTVEEVGLARAVGADCCFVFGGVWGEGATVVSDRRAEEERASGEGQRRGSTRARPSFALKKRTDAVDLGAEGLRDRLVLVGLEALDDDLLDVHRGVVSLAFSGD